MAQLDVTGRTSALTREWESALADLVVRYPDPSGSVRLEIVDAPEPTLTVRVDHARDTRDPAAFYEPLVISCVRLTYFPGVELARAWFAAAWSGYLQHEALELTTVGDLVTRPLDPHAAPFRFDRGLRDGFPVALTPETLERALAVAMPAETARALVAERGAA